jgi:TatD DNase family protein
MVNQCHVQEIDVFTMTTTPLAWSRNRELANGLPNIRVGLGLHPQLVAERAAEVELFEKLAPQADFIGEVGLDAGPRFYKSLDLQREIFIRILRASVQTGPKILSLHSVRSASKVLDCIEDVCGTDRDLGLVLHWFTGSKSEAQRALRMGCYFSVNPMMLKKESGRNVINAIPQDRLLTETDGPFTEKHAGSRYLPQDLGTLVRELGNLVGRSQETMQHQLHENLTLLEAKLVKRGRQGASKT